MSITEFLNVDLDLRSKGNLDVLLKEFGAAVSILNQDKVGYVSIELSSSKKSSSIDKAIEAYYNLVQSLSSDARTVWDKCETRSMNIGIQAGTEAHSKSFYISEKSISYLKLINAEIVTTIYSA